MISEKDKMTTITIAGNENDKGAVVAVYSLNRTNTASTISVTSRKARTIFLRVMALISIFLQIRKIIGD